MTHVPALAAGAEDVAPRRSLVLAGGGMRVAWQAGALIALEEAGLRFAHADGTSGGTMNLAMLLSGLAPVEMAERWRTLDVRRFAAPLSPRRMLRLPAFGAATGIVGHVFPHLGVDPAAIRAAEGLEGTFNTCNHATKACEAIGHRDIDLDALVAAITLPLAMPGVHRPGGTYLDAVWVKDANLVEAVRRGAEELWVLWCIGNTAAYRDGPFQQYVHMIEQSANGVLFEELDRIRELNAALEAGHAPYGQRRPIRVHVVRPRHPLPLDPDLFLGRIDAGSLVSMGYRDARECLAAPPVALDASATAMEDPGTRVWWRERWAGPLGRAELIVDVAQAECLPAAGRLAGRVTLDGVGDVLLRDGHVRLDCAALSYEGELDADGRTLALRARRENGGDAGELRPIALELREGDAAVARGVLRAAEDRAPHPTVRGTAPLRRRLAVAARFERLLDAEAVTGREHRRPRVR